MSLRRMRRNFLRSSVNLFSPATQIFQTTSPELISGEGNIIILKYIRSTSKYVCGSRKPILPTFLRYVACIKKQEHEKNYHSF